MKRKTPKTKSALDRLQVRVPDGPPYLVLILDTETVQAIRLGVVTSRAFVEADRVLRASQPLFEPVSNELVS